MALGLPGWLRVLISIHALLAESDLAVADLGKRDIWISIHALLAESDCIYANTWTLAKAISIHALLAESDDLGSTLIHQLGNFYPRSPCGERLKIPENGLGPVDFYPRSPCGERLLTEINKLATGQISIHALLAESDSQTDETITITTAISIHALLAESDFDNLQVPASVSKISIHALLAESDDSIDYIIDYVNISIHALLAESDAKKFDQTVFGAVFLSTLSLRRATDQRGFALTLTYISIHALLAESDEVAAMSAPTYCLFLSTLSLRRATRRPISAGLPYGNFYPRSPCGERQFTHKLTQSELPFLSTLSLRRATGHPAPCRSAPSISIHALLAESDRASSALSLCSVNFYPRSPCGERPGQLQQHTTHRDFYPRSPCGERLYGPILAIIYLTLFLSTLSLRRATVQLSAGH